MTTIAIIYFSGYGHTTKLAEAVQDGATTAGAASKLYRINDRGELSEEAWQDIEQADAIVYGSPTYMGGPAWQFKKFADASSKLFMPRLWKDKLAAGFTNSASNNGDKSSTLAYFWTFSQQHAQVWVGLDVLPANKLASTPADVNWGGGFSGVLGTSPADAAPDVAPRSGDIDTARRLGARIAEAAARWTRQA